jgi:hypothetical protein
VDPEPLERLLDPFENRRHGIALRARQLFDVFAAVAVLRRLLSAAYRLDRFAEALHLLPGVVVVVLPLNLVPGELQETSNGVAVGAVSRRRDDDRAGRIGRDHLDLNSLLRIGESAPVGIPRFENLAECFPVPGGRQP